MRTLTILAALALCGCSEAWEGYVYPNKNNLSSHDFIGTFTSLEQCRAASIGRLEATNAINRGTYECGLDCRGVDPRVCKRTER